MRCFVAVELNSSLTKAILELQNKLRGLDVKLIEPNNLHFTLKFLGEIDEKALDSVKEALAGLVADIPSFSIGLRGAGVFPNEKFIRVVWVGTEGQEFVNLHDAVNDALAGLFKKENASPHLTIARVKSAKSNKEIAAFVNTCKNMNFGSMAVDKIRLKMSTLTIQGPVYEDIAVYELR